MRRAPAAVGLLLAVPALAARPLALEVTLAPESATVGELVEATLALRGAPDDPARAPRFPDWSAGWGAAEVRDAFAPERSETPDGTVWSQRIVLAAYETGRLALPPVAVAIPGEPPTGVATPADLALEVRSVLPEGEAPVAPKPPAPPRPLGVPSAFVWTAAALAAAAAAAALLLLRRRRSSGAAAAPALAPWEELDRTLGAIGLGDAERGHAELSLALRRYLGRAFAMPAAQSSTSELGRRLGERGLDRELVRRAVRLLREVDQVKFARAAASGEALFHRVGEAREVARAVETHLHPPPSEAAA